MVIELKNVVDYIVRIKEKNWEEIHVDIFIKQYLGIACADVGQCGGVVASIKGNKSNAVGEWNVDEFSEGVRNDYEPGKCCNHERVKGEIAKEV